MSRPTTLETFGATDVGLKRSRNEDAYKILVPPRAAAGTLLLVADGMGGLGGGDTASKAAVEAITQRYYSAADQTDPAQPIRMALEAANDHLRRQARTIGLPRIGSTAAGVVIAPSGQAVVFNVGDSRVYLIRGDSIEQVSRDQSIVGQQLASGLITEAEARDSDNPNLTMFLGQPYPVEPVTSLITTQPGDVFVICTDGLWRHIEKNEIQDVVRGASVQEAARKLMQMVHDRGALDNVTLIIARVGQPASRINPRLLIAALVGALVIGVSVFALVLRSQGAVSPPALSPEATVSQSVINIISPTTAVSVIVISSATPTPTPAVTVTLTPTATATATRTSVPTQTPTPTFSVTPSATLTETLPPTASFTPTSAPTQTPRPTRTAVVTASRTPTPTETSEPTVTLAAGIAALEGTPLTPTTAPAPVSAADALLDFARQPAGVALNAAALLRRDLSDNWPQRPIPLSAGVQVRIVGEAGTLQQEGLAEVWWRVQVLSAPGIMEGWLPQSVLEAAQPPAPIAVVMVSSANVRAGDSTAYPIVQPLLREQYALIIGMNRPDTYWYQVRLANNRIGWIAGDVVMVRGDTSGVPIVLPPPLPTATPEATDIPTPETTPE